jgi:hypothetical protein
LAIREHDQSENSTNKGNYLKLIELLKGFMPIISEYENLSVNFLSKE